VDAAHGGHAGGEAGLEDVLHLRLMFELVRREDRKLCGCRVDLAKRIQALYVWGCRAGTLSGTAHIF
jgi:hypothetical protein